MDDRFRTCLEAQIHLLRALWKLEWEVVVYATEIWTTGGQSAVSKLWCTVLQEIQSNLRTSVEHFLPVFLEF